VKHWHVHLKEQRHIGALATTYEAAVKEAQVEIDGGHPVEKLVECHAECFKPRRP
jgi:hypothetical protein